MKRLRSLAAVTALLGISAMWYGVQASEEGAAHIAHKTFVAHWMETTLWADPRFMAVGAALVFLVAVVWLLITPRSGWDVLMSTMLVVAGIIGLFFTWAATLHHGNLTRSWPQ